jgi:replicative DNA helicase
LYAPFISSLSPTTKDDSIGEPLPIPFKSWHKFGGFARVLTPGKGMLIVARAGSGKTSMLESLADGWNRYGIDVLFYGAEWGAMEYVHRRVHRYCRDVLQQHEDNPDYWVSYDNFNLNNMAKGEVGMPDELRVGEYLSGKQIETAVRTMDYLMTWKGELEVLDGEQPLAALLEQASLSIDARRKAGRRVGVIIFDYLQIISGYDDMSEAQRLEKVLGAIKSWAIGKRIPWIVASQVGKQDSKDSRRAGAGLDADSALYVRDSKPNLLVTLDVKYEPNEYGVTQVKEGIVRIAKNSTGKLGKIEAMQPDFKRLRWIERGL